MLSDYPETHYAEIKATVPADLPARVLAVLKEHVGKDNRISRRDLVARVFNVNMNDIDLANSTLDRQVRYVLPDLQDRYPILSTSGGGGYYYAGSEDEIQRYAAELNSRAMKLLDKSRRLIKLAKRFRKEVQLQFPV